MHEAVADEFFPLYKARCAEDGVVTKGDAAAVKALGGEPCTDWAVEYSDKIISVKVRPCLCFCACMHIFCVFFPYVLCFVCLLLLLVAVLLQLFFRLHVFEFVCVRVLLFDCCMLCCLFACWLAYLLAG